MERLMKSHNDYLTTREAAALLGIRPNGVVQLIRHGRLPATKLARDWRIERQAVEQFTRQRPGRKAREGK
jgi:excisionase family DNA binding protein